MTNEKLDKIRDYLAENMEDCSYLFVTSTGDMQKENCRIYQCAGGMYGVEAWAFLLGGQLYGLYEQGVSFPECLKLVGLSLKSFIAMKLDPKQVPEFMQSYDVDFDKLMNAINYDPQGDRQFFFVGEMDAGVEGKQGYVIKSWGSYQSQITMVCQFFSYILSKYGLERADLWRDLELGLNKADKSTLINLGD